jgi:heme/copper-type cytochrome/quinol oxidase subunit 2
LDHIWNLNEIGLQTGRQVRIKVLAKRGAQIVYNTIPKSQEWLMVNYVVNVIGFLFCWGFTYAKEKYYMTITSNNANQKHVW